MKRAQARRKTCNEHRKDHPRTQAGKQQRTRSRSMRAPALGSVMQSITPAEWQAIWHAQAGRCPICDHALWNRYGNDARANEQRVAALDHDHAVETALKKAGVDPLTALRRSIRGLLCAYPCNRLLVRHWTAARLTHAAAYANAFHAQVHLTHGTTP